MGSRQVPSEGVKAAEIPTILASGAIRATCRATASMSITRLWTKYTCPSRPSSRRTAARISLSSQRMIRVSTGRRSGGGVSRFEISRMPRSAEWRVRGMGVAVMVRTWTVTRRRSAWAPNQDRNRVTAGHPLAAVPLSEPGTVHAPANVSDGADQPPGLGDQAQ